MTCIDKRILGTWSAQDHDGPRRQWQGAGAALRRPAANGVVCFQADGRMYCALCDGRAELPAGEPRQFMSYAGNYTFDGTTLTTKVDASSDTSRVGGDQVRTVRFENGGMVLAPPRRLYAGVMQHQELFWQRVG